MRISAKADYAVRAVVELAADTGEKPVKAERIATAQQIPLNFLENILGELRHAGIVRSHRGAEGGFRLARPAAEVTVADVIRAVERTASRLLRPGGLVIVEHSDRQGSSAPEVFVAAGVWAKIKDHRDHDQLDRFVTAVRR